MKTIDPRRLEEVERRYLGAQPVHKIETEVAAVYGVTRRQVQNYLAIVRKRLAEAAKNVTPEERRARVESMLLHAFAVAEQGSPVHGPDAKAMVQAAKTLAEVDGLTAPKKFEVATSVTVDGADLLREIRTACGIEADDAGEVRPAADVGKAGPEGAGG